MKNSPIKLRFNVEKWKYCFLTFTMIGVLYSTKLASAQAPTWPSEANTQSNQEYAAKNLAARQALLAETREKITALQPSQNADYDFALFMQTQNEMATKMAQEEVDHGTSPELKLLARKNLSALKKEQQQLKRWIESFEKYN